MGLLVDGKWQDRWYNTEEHGGKFVRDKARFRDEIKKGTRFEPERDRYHLFVSYACPWAHRTLIYRELKGLRDIIPVTVVHPHMLENGWELRDDKGNSIDPLYGFNFLYELYIKAQSDYSGRVTVPVLWDKKEETIVNNESGEIIRFLNHAFDEITGNHEDFYPRQLRVEIDDWNELIYKKVNNGVYRCGFATTQEAYEEAFTALFETLDRLEYRLTSQPFLFGKEPVETDWRLFTTLIRFDAVYFGHFKANRRRITEYPALSAYVARLYAHPGVAKTVHFDHIKQHYYFSHKHINPSQIVPLGPERFF